MLSLWLQHLIKHPILSLKFCACAVWRRNRYTWNVIKILDFCITREILESIPYWRLRTQTMTCVDHGLASWLSCHSLRPQTILVDLKLQSTWPICKGATTSAGPGLLVGGKGAMSAIFHLSGGVRSHILCFPYKISSVKF